MIPIRNLYYLLLYAYDALDEGVVGDAGDLPRTSVADLFAHVLDNGVNHLLRRGLDRGYVPHRDAVAGIRGRIDVAATVKTNVLTRSRAVCEFDELTADVLHNRIVRTTALRLMRAADLDPALHDRLAALHRRLGGVSDITLSARAFRSVQLHRNNRYYRFLLAVCRIIYEHLLVHEESGEARFREFERDERRMRRLFERFVRNFYRRHLGNVFQVGARQGKWVASGDTALLPTMRTDVTLRGKDRLIVVETKFTANQLQHHHGSASVRSAHLYQLFAYLQNVAATTDRRVEGILLYPQVGSGPEARCSILGHSVQFTTVDLVQEWQAIHERLLGLIAPA